MQICAHVCRLGNGQYWPTHVFDLFLEQSCACILAKVGSTKHCSSLKENKNRKG